MSILPDIDAALLPPAVRDVVRGYYWSGDDIGRSSADVFRLEAAGRPAIFVKTEARSPFSELAGECARLRWLGSQGFACPEVLAHDIGEGCEWLVMTAIPGADLTRPSTMPPRDRLRLLADALRSLHATDAQACPFDHRLDARIVAARQRMLAGLVDEEDFDDSRLGRAARDLFFELEARRPASEAPVVTHGDASLPNFLTCDDRFAGFVDCGRLGIADRYQDIALACRSIEYNFGRALVAPFLDFYGLRDVDAERMSYYMLLDEFF